MKHTTKSILRPKTASKGQKWMISKREHRCLVLFPLEIMFANTFPNKYLCAYYFSTGRAHDGPKFTNTITQNIQFSQHLNFSTPSKNSTKKHSPKKGTTKTPAKTSTPTKRQNGDTRNNEYLVQQQNRVQYRTISKYKTPDKMEKTSENQPHQTNGERVKSDLRMHSQKTYGEYDVRSKHDPCIDATHHAQHRQNMHRARSSHKMYSERSLARETCVHGNKHTATQCSKIRTLHRRSIGEQQMTHVLNSP